MMRIETPGRSSSSSSSNIASCSICLAEIGQPVLTLDGAPYLLGVTTREQSTDRFISFGVYVCPDCDLIQTDARIDEEIYSEIHSHAVGKVWEQHRVDFAGFIQRSIGTEEGSCLEIGPSVSPIIRCVGRRFRKIKYIDMMDSAPFELNEHEAYQKGYLAKGSNADTFDLIVASHVLEHVPNMHAFMKDLSDVLRPNGSIVFSIPNFYEWIRQGFWNALSFEHVGYPFEKQIERLAAISGFTAKFEYFRDHSIFIHLTRSNAKQVDTVFAARDSKQLLKDWSFSINDTIKKFEERLLEDGRVVFAGASHLSQYLYLMSPKLARTCLYVIDNAASKHGLRLYGTGLKVKPFSAVRESPNLQVFIPPSPYQTEMANQVMNENGSSQPVV